MPNPDHPASPTLLQRVIAEVDDLDGAVYGAVAATPTPTLDPAMRALTSAADYSRLWIGASGILALAGGQRGRRAAVHALAAIGIASAVTNLVVKSDVQRTRPARGPRGRGHQVKMPGSSSFPSGHTASAFAFATAISQDYPLLALPAYAIATAVGYSRVHAGVHYPGDVMAGAVLGSSVASMVLITARSSRSDG